MITYGGKQYFLRTNGAMSSNRWERVGGSWYFFTSGGAMKTGWHRSGSSWYYLKSDGKMAAGETLTINGESHSFNADGKWIRPSR